MVLLVSLSLLLALTLGAVSAAQTTVLELRMARNGADSALAFYAAESALLQAEAALDGGVADSLLAVQAYGDDAPWEGHDWPDTPSSGAVVEAIATVVDSRFIEIDVFRITARGVGRGGAIVQVQGTYGVPRSPGAARELTGRLSWVRLN